MSPKNVVFGSGRIEHVKKFLNSRDSVCPCSKRGVSKHPSSSWGIIRVGTSTGLVLDDFEINSATCRLFYDGEENGSVIDLDVIMLESFDAMKDSCKLQCPTCNMTLVSRLDKLVDTFTQAWERAFDEHLGDMEAEIEKMAVIVSHPHGYYKHISIGQWTDRHEQVNEDMVSTQYVYNTPTCPGSAGAHVLIPDFSVDI